MLTNINNKAIIAMIHLLPLPGTPAYQSGSIQAIIQQAITEAKIYQKAGVDVLLIENMHDLPYLKGDVGHEISTIMAIVGKTVKEACDLPCGVQVLAGANKAALAVAKAAQLDFIRAEGFVFGHVADEGWIDASAGELLRYRKQIDADNIAIWTDIKKKHSAHALTADVDLVETAKAASFFKSDGLIITGTATGAAASIADLQNLAAAKLNLPIFIGSGINPSNIADYWDYAQGFIIGSYFKKEAYWANEVEAERVEQLMAKVRQLRSV